MAWEDHPELLHAPGDGYDDTEHDEDGDDMHGFDDDIVDWMTDPMREAQMAKRIAMARHPAGRRRPILPLEVAMAAAAPAGAERFGSEPPIGTVLRWSAPGRYGQGVTLTYLAVRVGNGDWYSTGSSRGSMSWAQLVHVIGDKPCHVATAWTEIPAPEPEPQGDDVVAAWASQFRRADVSADGRGPIGEAAAEAVNLDEAAEGWQVRCRSCGRVLGISADASVLPDHISSGTSTEFCTGSGSLVQGAWPSDQHPWRTSARERHNDPEQD